MKVTIDIKHKDTYNCLMSILNSFGYISAEACENLSCIRDEFAHYYDTPTDEYGNFIGEHESN